MIRSFESLGDWGVLPGANGPLRASADPSTGSGQVYEKAMNLAVYLEKIVRNFSRYHKYALGSEPIAKSREIVG